MKLKLLGGLAVVFVVVLAGCGGDDNKSSTTNTGAATSTTTTGGASAAGTVDVSLTDFKINPSDPKVKAGQVEFKVTNDGKTEHSLEIEGPTGEAKLASNLSPGASGTLKVDLSKPGKYEWYCPVDDHKGLGMKGEVTVGGGGSTTTGETGTNTTDTTETQSGGSGGGSSSGSGGSGGGY